MDFFRQGNKRKTDAKPNLSDIDELEKTIENTDIPDEYNILLKALTDLEEFTINIYTTHMTLVQLLISKQIITETEFLHQKEITRFQPEICALYREVENKRKIMIGELNDYE